MTPSDRAYSLLTVKAVDDDKRTITGIATTPETDRQDDIVEPKGAEFDLPIPLLWMHDSSQPIGKVTKAKVTAEGIEITAQIENVSEPGRLKDRLDEAWQSIKLGLVRGLSIGFKAIETAQIEGTFGIRFIKWLWLELSAVTIPANADASITSIKSIDADFLARVRADWENGNDQPALASVVARKAITRVVTAQGGRRTMAKQTIPERISGYEATRASKAAELQALQDKADDEGQTKDATAKEAFNNLFAEIEAIDSEIIDLRRMEKLNVQKAVVVNGNDAEAASRSRESIPRVQVMKRQLLPGMGFTRYVLALCRAKGNIMHAAELAKANEQWRAETPEVESVLKAAVAAGTTTGTTWAAPLVEYQILTGEFIEYLRPLTIIGRIPGLTRVPFKVKIPRQTGASTVNWVGEGKVKPLSALAFDSVTLDFAKIAGIVVLTDELVRHSNPAAEALVRNDLARSIVEFMDLQFVDPTKAATDVSPASITNGVTATLPTGTTAAALRNDVATLMQTFLDSNQSPSSAVWIMTQGTAMKIGLMTNSLGNPDFPGIDVNGGTFMGLPVVASEGVPATGNSPTDGYPIILCKASEILLADDGNVTIDASREASLQMDDAPDSPPTASTNMVSLFQHNMMAIRAEREINWKKRRTEAVAYISNAKYADS